jgi:hypothetical protein
MSIHVRNWEKFQHADVAKRKHGTPPWIRVYTELLSREEFRSLTMPQRGLLVSLWIEYARSPSGLPADTERLAQRLDAKVEKRSLEVLRAAGFIEFKEVVTRAEKRTPRAPRVRPDAAEMSRRNRPDNAESSAAPLNHEAQREIRHAAVTPLSRLEERREEQTVRSSGSVDVAAPLDVDELEAWEPPADNVVPLDSRRPQGEVNGKPIGDVVKPLLDGLLARAQSP